MQKIKVLYAEDDAVQAAMVIGALEDDGYLVTRVANGYEVLEAIKDLQFDIVLTDYRMPKMDGLSLVKNLLARKLDIPSVILTVANDVSLAFTALDAGATDFILKDSDGNYLDILSSVLKRALEKHRLKLRMKQLSNELQEQRKLSHQVLDSLDQGVVLVDAKQSVLFANKQFRHLFMDEGRLQGNETLHDLSHWLKDHSSLHNNITQVDVYNSLCRLIAGEISTLDYNLWQEDVIQLRASKQGNGDAVLTCSDITLQKKQTLALVRTVEWAPVAMIGVNKERVIVLANQQACQLTGYSKEELKGMALMDLVPMEHRANHDRYVDGYFSNIKPGPMRGGVDLNVLQKNGNKLPVQISLSGLEIMKETRVLASIVDISARKEAEEAIRRANEMTQSIIDNSPFSIMATNHNGIIVAASPAVEQLLGYSKEELIGLESPTKFHLAEELSQQADILSERLKIQIFPTFEVLVAAAKAGLVESTEFTLVRKDGTKVPVNLTVTLLSRDKGLPTGYLFVAYDITEQQLAQKQIRYIAQHDSLTGLPNRVLLDDRLQMALLRVKRYGAKLGILMLDLDGFKEINDTLGHGAGDQLLQIVAQRLKANVRASDTAARLGGDEFVVMLPDLNSIAEAQMVCEKIIVGIAAPMVIDNQEVSVTVSVGVCIAPDHGQTIEQILRNADAAMYLAKRSGKNAYKVFTAVGNE